MQRTKVLITGGEGFVGSHLVDYLQKTKKYEITVFDKLKGKDLLNKKDITKVFEQYGPFTTIFHLASAMPNKEYKDSMIWKINVEGIQNLLKEAVKHKTASFVFTSSNVVYGIPDTLPYTEKTPPHPLEMYGKSKIAAEKELAKYKSELDITILRCPVISGTGRLGLQAILFGFIAENKNVYLLGKGDNIFQFVDVEDVCQALELASHKKGFAIYTIGADKPLPLRAMYQKVIEFAGSSSKIVALPKTPALFVLSILDKLNLSPLGIYQYTMLGKSLYADTTKIKKELGWNPKKTNLDTFIENYQWYLQHKGNFKSKRSANRSVPKMGILKILKFFS